MARCVIDIDNIFVEEQYYDDCRTIVDADVPEIGEHQCARWNGDSWDIIPDYRGCIVTIGDGEDKIWRELGELPDGVKLVLF